MENNKKKIQIKRQKSAKKRIGFFKNKNLKNEIFSIMKLYLISYYFQFNNYP